MKILWKEGVTRTVVLTRRWAFKFPSVANGWKYFLYGFFANMQEREWSGFDGRLCPIRVALPGGLLVVMPRCLPVTDAQFSALVPEDWPEISFQEKGDSGSLPVEMKSNSFGWLNGRIVAIDYGGCGREGRTTRSVPCLNYR